MLVAKTFGGTPNSTSPEDLHFEKLTLPNSSVEMKGWIKLIFDISYSFDFVTKIKQNFRKKKTLLFFLNFRCMGFLK